MTTGQVLLAAVAGMVGGLWMWIAWIFFVIPRQDRKARLASEEALRKRWDSE